MRRKRYAVWNVWNRLLYTFDSLADAQRQQRQERKNGRKTLINSYWHQDSELRFATLDDIEAWLSA